MAGNTEDRNSMYWFVRRRSDNYLIGTAGLVNLNYGRRSVEWGYGVDPTLWGLGYILQIQEILKHFVFEVLELNRLDGITMINNERTISSLLSVGMKHEGILRQFYCKNGIFIDGWKYAMLKEEYFQLKIEQSHAIELIPTEGVIELIQSVLEEEIIDGYSDMENTKSWDSLNHMNIIVAIYSKYGFQLTPNQVARARSVSEICQILNAKKIDN
jgi:acyl carrier protein